MDFVSGEVVTVNWVINGEDCFPTEYNLTDERKKIGGIKFAKLTRVDTGKVQWLTHAKLVLLTKEVVLEPEDTFTA